MIIKIKISKREKEHLETCDSSLDSCGVVQDIIRKIKVQLKKR
jgi:hypothetical protein